MKLIIAIVRPEKLPDVKKSLMKENIPSISIIDIKGCGQQKGFMEEYRGIIEEVNLYRKVMILIASKKSNVDKTVKAIISGARTNSGKIGDGKIFVLPLADAIRIRTGESGIQALEDSAKKLWN